MLRKFLHDESGATAIEYDLRGYRPGHHHRCRIDWRQAGRAIYQSPERVRVTLATTPFLSLRKAKRRAGPAGEYPDLTDQARKKGTGE